jgi:hypothetical protein
MNNKFLAIILVILFLIIGIAFILDQEKKQIEQIKFKIASLDGHIIEIKQPFLNIGPFKWWEKGKYDHVYCFSYMKYGEKHEGWALFPSWGKAKWVMK